MHHTKGVPILLRILLWSIPTHTSFRRSTIPSLVLVLLAAACTHGPPEQRARLVNWLRVPEAYRAVFAVEYERFQRPTGINTFPNGGVLRMLEQAAVVHVGDVGTGEVHELVRIPAPDSVWETFGAFLVGIEASAVYLQLDGCARGSDECYGSLRSRQLYRVALVTGWAARASSVPPTARPKGEMLGRRPGERVYLRLSRWREGLAARTDPDAEFRPVFRIDSLGGAHAIGTDPARP